MNIAADCRHGVFCRAPPSQRPAAVRPSRRRLSAPRSNGACLRPDDPLASGSSLTGWQTAFDRREWNQDDAAWVAEQTSRQARARTPSLTCPRPHKGLASSPGSPRHYHSIGTPCVNATISNRAQHSGLRCTSPPRPSGCSAFGSLIEHPPTTDWLPCKSSSGVQDPTPASPHS